MLETQLRITLGIALVALLAGAGCATDPPDDDDSADDDDTAGWPPSDDDAADDDTAGWPPSDDDAGDDDSTAVDPPFGGSSGGSGGSACPGGCSEQTGDGVSYRLPADAPYSGAGSSQHGSTEQFLAAVSFFPGKTRN